MGVLMAIIPINELPEKAASKVIPLSSLPVGEKKASPIKQALQTTGNIALDALSRTAKDGPTSFENITGGVGQAFGQNVKRVVLDKAIPSKGFIASSFKEAVVQGTYGGNVLLPQAIKSFATPEDLIKESQKNLTKAEKLTAQVLQPTSKDLADSIMSGKPLPSIKRGAENIRASSTFEEMVDSLKNTTKELFEERNMILTENNLPIGSEALESLSELANNAVRNKVLSPGKIRKFDDVFYRELQFLEENPGLDVVSAQSRKEILQDLTRPLLEKRKAGNLTGSEQVELQAYDALRSGYRKAILKALPKDKSIVVDKINSKYEGLLEATDLASKQAAKAFKEIPQTLLEKIGASFGLSPKFTAFKLVNKELGGLVGSTNLKRTTSKIAELRNKSATLRSLASLAKKV